MNVLHNIVAGADFAVVLGIITTAIVLLYKIMGG